MKKIVKYDCELNISPKRANGSQRVQSLILEGFFLLTFPGNRYKNDFHVVSFNRSAESIIIVTVSDFFSLIIDVI